MHLRYFWTPCLLAAFVLTSHLSYGQEKKSQEKKHIVFVAGKPSHGYGSHEHLAGCRILAETVEKLGKNVTTSVQAGGWPTDLSVFDGCDAVVIYSDGGGGHPVMGKFDTLQPHIDRGIGFVCLHYAVEVPKGEPGDTFIKWLGGYFETHWSVNPHWDASYTKFPDHPITRGVAPFSANDEWYYHMRFPADMKGVTPILSALPPESTLRRSDGPHSGNPDVRRAVAAGEPQHTAWAFERPDGGRSFGFTGGHFHWNWGRPEIRRLVANAILWSAGVEVPEAKDAVAPLPVEKLAEGQDESKPQNFNEQKIREEFHLSSVPTAAGDSLIAKVKAAQGRELFASPMVTSKTPGHRVKIDVPLEKTEKLFLVVSDGGDGFACDWANWLEPKLVGKAGSKSLMDLTPVRAESGFGKVHVNKNCTGQPLTVQGEPVGEGFGTHANSVIEFKIPPGYDRFQAIGALDSGGTNQQGGGATSVRFFVYSDAVPSSVLVSATVDSTEQRAPEQAVSGLTVAEGLAATLSASEPHLKSLTNLDVDHRGRVWVCDVVNYRGNKGKRPEGDRILILEDTNQDGVMESVKTYFQGPEVDSAMGICVLGNEVIVSATPNIWRFIDDDGDDRPDRREAIFTNTGTPQHDHSSHSFLFGPDGRYYWNFGNTGKAVHDAEGKPVVDIHGRPVIDNGKPFFGGMVFRCDRDGKQFEVLGHNFRNNYEVTIDSFGRLWQSDNDDDGNRGVRINYVVEQGNYGYRDELTGAGWQAERIGWEQEIPLRHWHLNDPGVMPNLVQTGAGSPTGITVNEGDLLPAIFKNQVIHCDAGPNVVRAYPVQASGAGFTGTMENIVVGERDRWFRPADACVAPDGSLFVSDWYDPGVGGHRQEDLDRGRLIRIAPPGVPYKVPQFDFETVEGAAEAMRSPNLSVRYLAWQTLNKKGAAAEPALTKLWNDANPRIRARALWLLGQISGREKHWGDAALGDADADIRATGVRLARLLKISPVQIANQVEKDASPAVRLEALVSLRFDTSPEMPAAWAKLAAAYTGNDRWYLESLGLASDLRGNECLAAWQKLVGDQWRSPAGRDIVWRVRAEAAAGLMAEILASSESKPEGTDRYFRALEYHQPIVREAALKQVIAVPQLETAVLIRALERLPNQEWLKDEKLKGAVEQYVAKAKGTPEYLRLAKQFRLPGMEDSIFELAISQSDKTVGVEAAETLVSTESGSKRFAAALRSDDVVLSGRAAQVLGLVGKPDAMRLLIMAIRDKDASFQLRSDAVRAALSSNLGQKRVIELAKEKTLPGDLRLLAGGLLARVSDQKLRQEAAELFPMPKAADQAPLPPLDQLVSRQGNAETGLVLFRTKATCANCHVVSGQGKAVGPDLSEIGSKLTREALYVSIVDPSAGISHNFENFSALLDSGQIISGVMVSQDAQSVTLRTAEAIDRKLERDSIEELVKSEKSMMPENLHHLFDLQGLVDVVEYLTTLKTKK